ncbi:MAG TPA: DUF2301 domain-containing membrane protein, partial [Dissulfurispiraceae bacterium]|nr:DUF2301 domain-containing membrane protein [Dissulfurispiraceae bacterium]
MGEQAFFQTLTQGDKISVILYRAGIVLSTLFVLAGAFFSSNTSRYQDYISFALLTNMLLILLYAAVGISVFFIHLYVSKFHRALKKLYYIAVISLITLYVIGRGDVLGVLVSKIYGPLMLLPLAGCLGFIAAKEAFCFRLFEGYFLALIMPLYLVILAARGLTAEGASYGLISIAALLVVFTLRKVFMPL